MEVERDILIVQAAALLFWSILAALNDRNHDG
jgi:hypothetical protein